MITLIVALIIFVCVFPSIMDAPVHRRRRQGITIWDEMYARGEITREQWQAAKELE
jgi:uncharacterized membrane protein